VYESNGPDVKVRGTAQTIADKYLQLGRDAQSSGDIVMAESYFQHAEHYLRIVFAAQAYNQQAQQQYRRPDEEFDDEDLEDHPEPATGQALPEPDGLGDQPVVESAPERPPHQPNQGQRQHRDSRDQNREQGGRERFRPRWQDRRNENQPAQGSEPRHNAPQPRADDEQPRVELAPSAPAGEDRWEAPSFLRRPAPAPASPPEEAPADTVAAAPKRRYERRPRKDVAVEGSGSAGTDAKEPAAD
jgi:hypothetical protein